MLQVSTLKAGNAHIHGQAYINIVLDNQDLIIEAKLSAYDIVGFEYQPKSETENNKVDIAVRNLYAAGDWLSTEKGECIEHKVNLDSPFDMSKGEFGASYHDDFVVTINFKCEKPQDIFELQIKLMQIFSKIKSLQIQWLVHNKQGLEHLHGNNQAVRFK